MESLREEIHPPRLDNWDNETVVQQLISYWVLLDITEQFQALGWFSLMEQFSVYEKNASNLAGVTININYLDTYLH